MKISFAGSRTVPALPFPVFFPSAGPGPPTSPERIRSCTGPWLNNQVASRRSTAPVQWQRRSVTCPLDASRQPLDAQPRDAYWSIVSDLVSLIDRTRGYHWVNEAAEPAPPTRATSSSSTISRRRRQPGSVLAERLQSAPARGAALSAGGESRSQTGRRRRRSRGEGASFRRRQPTGRRRAFGCGLTAQLLRQAAPACGRLTVP